MKFGKKVISGVVSAIMLVCSFGIVSDNKSAKAADLSKEPIIYDVEYEGAISETNRWDEYKLVVPSNGTVTVSGYNDFDHFMGVFIFDKTGKKSITGEGQFAWGSQYTEKNPYEKSFVLDAGTYVVKIGTDFGYENIYHYTFSYNFDSSSNARIESVGKGKLKITAPKGTKNNGFEVRYKVAKSKKWRTKSVATTKNLNKVFTGFSSGRTYHVQVRKYVKDSYGYVYYSNWTKVKSVKIK